MSPRAAREPAVRCRAARRADVESLADLGQRAYRVSSLERRREFYTDHPRFGLRDVRVAELEGAIVGFGSLSTFRSRPAYATTVEDSVYLLDGHLRRGIGRALLDELVRLAALHGFHSVIARITGENDASIALHAACGFELVGTEREVGRKFGQWLDVVEMQLML